MAETSIAYVFPGQGSQWVGMGHDLYQQFDSARVVFQEADRILGFPLSRLCFEGPEDELKKTINVQPAIVTVSYACLQAAVEKGLPRPAFVAGHSLGEYTALAAAAVLDFTTTVHLARERGRLMHEAGLKQPGGMAAIMGVDEASLGEICNQTGTRIANINSPGQIVISGAREDLAQALDVLKSRGGRAIPLQVSGAFHSQVMQPAADGLAQVVASLTFRPARIPIIANTTAQPVTSTAMIKEELLRQLCNCVRWQDSVQYMISNGVTRFIEIGPGKVLTGLIKRINKDVSTVNISDAEAVKTSTGA
jgi:[acyl-carrier-protein] S-malonyltransferase